MSETLFAISEERCFETALAQLSFEDYLGPMTVAGYRTDVRMDGADQNKYRY